MQEQEQTNETASPVEAVVMPHLSGSILEEIHIAIACHQMHTGKPATNIYLGYSEMKRLLAWFEKIRYVKSKSSDDVINGKSKSSDDVINGKSRVEILGIPVFEVNAEQHCFVA